MSHPGRRKLAALAVLGLAALSLLPLSGADAHNPNNIYGPPEWRWPTSRDRLEFFWHKSVPTGRWRRQISEGAREWNRYNRRVYFVPGDPGKSRTGDPAFKCPTKNPSPNLIFKVPFPQKYQDFIGYNWRCRDRSNKLLYFRQFYNDTFTRWWTDPKGNKKIPYNKVDVQATAAHEMGHATGWHGHLDEDGPDENSRMDFKPYCRSYEGQDKADDVYKIPAGATPYTGKQTMCSILTSGTTAQRTLGQHDRGTFRNAYGPR